MSRAPAISIPFSRVDKGEKIDQDKIVMRDLFCVRSEYCSVSGHIAEEGGEAGSMCIVVVVVMAVFVYCLPAPVSPRPPPLLALAEIDGEGEEGGGREGDTDSPSPRRERGDTHTNNNPNLVQELVGREGGFKTNSLNYFPHSPLLEEEIDPLICEKSCALISFVCLSAPLSFLFDPVCYL